MELCLLILIIAFGAGATANALVKLVIAKAPKWGALDIPDARKIHSSPTPRMGGLSIIPGIWLGTAVALVCLYQVPWSGFAPDAFGMGQVLIGFMLGSFGMFLIGVVDDLKRLAASHKLLFQVIMSIVAFQFLPIPETIMGFDIPYWVTAALMLSWLVVIPNSVNLLDGVDGLTGCLFLLFSICLGVLAIVRQEFIWLVILAPTCAATIAFLRYNWNPARIFLGDSGSLTLGFTVAYFGLAFSISSTSVVSDNWNIALTLSLTSIWLMDTVYAVVRRYAKKAPSLEILFRRSKMTYLGLQSKALGNVIRPDRLHLHHRLISLGLGAKQVVLVLASVWVSMLFLGSVWMIDPAQQDVLMTGLDAGHLLLITSSLGGLIILANILILAKRLRRRVVRRIRLSFGLSTEQDLNPKSKAA